MNQPKILWQSENQSRYFGSILGFTRDIFGDLLIHPVIELIAYDAK